jgi:hypothetical protein
VAGVWVLFSSMHLPLIFTHCVIFIGADMADNKYSQRQWDRTVGYGEVPDEYKMGEAEDNWKESYSKLQKIKDAQKECTVCYCPITQKDYDEYKMCPWCYSDSAF